MDLLVKIVKNLLFIAIGAVIIIAMQWDKVGKYWNNYQAKKEQDRIELIKKQELKQMNLAAIKNYRIGLGQYNKNQIVDAIASLTKSVTQNKDNSDAWTVLGKSYFKQGNIDKALDALGNCNSGTCTELSKSYRTTAFDLANGKGLAPEFIKAVVSQASIQFGNSSQATTCGLVFTYHKIASGKWKLPNKASQLKLAEIASAMRPEKSLNEMSYLRSDKHNFAQRYNTQSSYNNRMQAMIQQRMNAIKRSQIRNNFLHMVNLGAHKAKKYLKTNILNTSNCTALAPEHNPGRALSARSSYYNPMRSSIGMRLTYAQTNYARKIYHYSIIRVFHRQCLKSGNCKIKMAQLR